MIQFFRKIRQGLLTENKFNKYLFYAIGEIILVVIGILIAVGINSTYNAAQNDAKIKNILTQVQNDLVTDIIDAKRIFNVYIEKDTLFRKIMSDSFTFEKFKEDPQPILSLNLYYVSFSTKKGGYTRFLENLENLPEKYNDLLPHFNTLYVEMQNDIDDYNTFIKNTVMVDGSAIFKTNPKIADYMWGKYPEEGLENFFNNPYLRNRSFQYINDLGNITQAANDYRIESIRLYKKIDSLLGKFPTEYDAPLSSIPIKEQIDSFLGDYMDRASNSEDTFSLILEKGQLIAKRNNEPDLRLYWNEGEYYYIPEVEFIIRLYKNKEGQHIIEGRMKELDYQYIKIEDK